MRSSPPFLREKPSASAARISSAYDILFFDWVLLCHSNFFPRFYPEVKGIVGPHLFGYNKKAHLVHFLLYIPLSAALAWVCTLF